MEKLSLFKITLEFGEGIHGITPEQLDRLIAHLKLEAWLFLYKEKKE